MLYSVPFNGFGGKDYRIKIGTLELAKFQEKNIDIDAPSIKDNFEIMCIALKELDSNTNKLKHVNMKVEEFMELWDESDDYNLDDLIDLVEEAIKKGLYKGREQKKREE
jgi:hypothetical protein